MDVISRQAAINLLKKWAGGYQYIETDAELAIKEFQELPSAQPTLYGYSIEHLELIARVLQKENLPPGRVVEALTDIARIVAIVRDEFAETLRKAVDQCSIVLQGEENEISNSRLP